MSSAIISAYNLLDHPEATLSGGSWDTDAPLSNLQKRGSYLFARSTDDATASTQFQLNLPDRQGHMVRVVALCHHNLSVDAQVRIRAYGVSVPAVEWYDSGWVNPYGSTFVSAYVEQGWPGLVFGEYANFPQEYVDDGQRVDAVFILDDPIDFPFWLIEIDDTTNPDGEVRIGRAWIGYGVEPSWQSDGGSIGYFGGGERLQTESGSQFLHETGEAARTMSLVFEGLEEDEAMELLYELKRRASAGEQVFVVGDSSDTTHRHRRSFLATIDGSDPITVRTAGYAQTIIRLREDL